MIHNTCARICVLTTVMFAASIMRAEPPKGDHVALSVDLPDGRIIELHRDYDRLTAVRRPGEDWQEARGIDYVVLKTPNSREQSVVVWSLLRLDQRTQGDRIARGRIATSAGQEPWVVVAYTLGAPGSHAGVKLVRAPLNGNHPVRPRLDLATDDYNSFERVYLDVEKLRRISGDSLPQPHPFRAGRWDLGTISSDEIPTIEHLSIDEAGQVRIILHDGAVYVDLAIYVPCQASTVEVGVNSQAKILGVTLEKPE